MSILTFMALMAQQDDCPSSSPSLTSITKTADSIGTCIGTGWLLEWTLAVSGSIQPGQEYYWEVATNAAGDNWSFWKRTQTLVQDGSDDTLGTDGSGGSATHYRRVRAYVVPINAGTDEACSGPVTSNLVSRTADICVE